MLDEVPNLRGGMPGWIVAALGLCGGMAAAIVPVIVTIARMPDATRFEQVRDDVSAIKQKIAVMEAESGTGGVTFRSDNAPAD